MTAEESFENLYEEQMRLLAKTLIELNLSVETIYRILLDKGICTDKDIKETREELLKSDDGFRESLEKIDIAENINEILHKQLPTEEDKDHIRDVFRKDIIPYQKMKDMKPESEWTEEDWKKVCPEYGKGFSHMSGLYCDHCTSLYDKNRKLCPNNHQQPYMGGSR